MSDKKEMTPGVRLDLRIRRTRGAIREAFILLMQKKEYAAITVTDISEQAGINRKTFYAHYETKEQLISQMLEEMFRDMIGTLMYRKTAMIDSITAVSLEEDLIIFFEKVNGYREALDTLITPQTSWMAFELADEMIRGYLKQNRVDDMLVPIPLYVAQIKNFFLTSMDWWMEQPAYTTRQAAQIYREMMCTRLSDIFGYQEGEPDA